MEADYTFSVLTVEKTQVAALRFCPNSWKAFPSRGSPPVRAAPLIMLQ